MLTDSDRKPLPGHHAKLNSAKPDLLQLITTDSGPIITRCSERLTSTFMHSWVRASEEDAGVLARAIVRLCMSYVSMPPEADHDVARDLARLMTPFAERYGVIAHRLAAGAGRGSAVAVRANV